MGWGQETQGSATRTKDQTEPLEPGDGSTHRRLRANGNLNLYVGSHHSGEAPGAAGSSQPGQDGALSPKAVESPQFEQQGEQWKDWQLDTPRSRQASSPPQGGPRRGQWTMVRKMSRPRVPFPSFRTHRPCCKPSPLPPAGGPHALRHTGMRAEGRPEYLG